MTEGEQFGGRFNEKHVGIESIKKKMNRIEFDLIWWENTSLGPIGKPRTAAHFVMKSE